MSDNLPRLANLVRRDLERAGPVITSSRLDDMIAMAHDWRRIGLPTSSMGGGNGHGSGPADPTSQDATTVDEGNRYYAEITEHLDGLQRHLRGLIRLDMEAPASALPRCANRSCNKSLKGDDLHRRLCSKCRKRRQRTAA